MEFISWLYPSQIWLEGDHMLTLIPDLGGEPSLLPALHLCGFVYIIFMTDWGCCPGWCKPVLIQRGQCRLCSLPFGAAAELCRAGLCDLYHCSTVWISSFVLLLQFSERTGCWTGEKWSIFHRLFKYSSFYFAFLHHQVVYFPQCSCDIIIQVKVLFRYASDLMKTLSL